MHPCFYLSCSLYVILVIADSLGKIFSPWLVRHQPGRTAVVGVPPTTTFGWINFTKWCILLLLRRRSRGIWNAPLFLLILFALCYFSSCGFPGENFLSCQLFEQIFRLSR